MQNPMPEHSEIYGHYTVRVACASRDELARLVGEDPMSLSYIDQLAGLGVLDYERERKRAAKELRVRLKALDCVVAKARRIKRYWASWHKIGAGRFRDRA